MVSEVTMDKVFMIAADTLHSRFEGWRKAIPKPIRMSGIYPLKGGCTATQTADPGANPDCFARYSVSPFMTQTIRTSKTSIIVPKGYSVSGKLNVLGTTFGFEAIVDSTRFYVKAVMDPVNIAGLITISRNSRDTKRGPIFLMDFNAVPPKALIHIEGFISIPVLLVRSSVMVKLGAKGVNAVMENRIFGMFDARLEIGWSWNLARPDLKFKAVIKARSFRDMLSNVKRSITNVINKAEKFIQDIQRKIQKAHNYAKHMCSTLKRQRKISGFLYHGCRAFGWAVKNALKGIMYAAEKILNLAKRAIQGLIKVGSAKQRAKR